MKAKLTFAFLSMLLASPSAIRPAHAVDIQSIARDAARNAVQSATQNAARSATQSAVHSATQSAVHSATQSAARSATQGAVHSATQHSAVSMPHPTISGQNSGNNPHLNGELPGRAADLKTKPDSGSKKTTDQKNVNLMPENSNQPTKNNNQPTSSSRVVSKNARESSQTQSTNQIPACSSGQACPFTLAGGIAGTNDCSPGNGTCSLFIGYPPGTSPPAFPTYLGKLLQGDCSQGSCQYNYSVSVSTPTPAQPSSTRPTTGSVPSALTVVQPTANPSANGSRPVVQYGGFTITCDPTSGNCTSPGLNGGAPGTLDQLITQAAAKNAGSLNLQQATTQQDTTQQDTTQQATSGNTTQPPGEGNGNQRSANGGGTQPPASPSPVATNTPNSNQLDPATTSDAGITAGGPANNGNGTQQLASDEGACLPACSQKSVTSADPSDFPTATVVDANGTPVNSSNPSIGNGQSFVLTIHDGSVIDGNTYHNSNGQWTVESSNGTQQPVQFFATVSSNPQQSGFYAVTTSPGGTKNVTWLPQQPSGGYYGLPQNGATPYQGTGPRQ